MGLASLGILRIVFFNIIFELTLSQKFFLLLIQYFWPNYLLDIEIMEIKKTIKI